MILLPDPPLSALTTTDAKVVEYIPTNIGTNDDESGTRSEGPIVMMLNPVASTRYVFTPYFTFLNALGVIHRYLLGGGILYSHCRLFLSCFFSRQLWFEYGTEMSS